MLNLPTKAHREYINLGEIQIKTNSNARAINKDSASPFKWIVVFFKYLTIPTVYFIPDFSELYSLGIIYIYTYSTDPDFGECLVDLEDYLVSNFERLNFCIFFLFVNTFMNHNMIYAGKTRYLLRSSYIIFILDS